jgi:hypothetical protein
MELSNDILMKLELQKLDIFKNSDITSILKDYTDQYKLHDWIELDKLDLNTLCLNPKLNEECYELLKKNKKEINWKYLSENPSKYAIKLLKENEDKIDLNYLAGNINSKAIEILANKVLETKNLDNVGWLNLWKNPSTKVINLLIKLLKEKKINIVWKGLCENPNKHAIKMIKDLINEDEINKREIDIVSLARNTNPEATKLLLKIITIEEINDNVWDMLSMNPNEIAFELIQNNKDKVNWKRASLNKNKKVLEILNKEFSNKIVWNWISGNKSGIGLLKKNMNNIWIAELCGNENPKALKLLFQKIINIDDIDYIDYIDWETISANPIIFKKINLLKFNSKEKGKAKTSSKTRSNKKSSSSSIKWEKVYNKVDATEYFQNRVDEMEKLEEFKEKSLKPVLKSKIRRTKPKSI